MDQVVCIKQGAWTSVNPADPPFLAEPIKGLIYTIERIKIYNDETYFFLAEFPGKDCWLSDHFRPVKNTDISCFTSLLKTKKREKDKVT